MTPNHYEQLGLSQSASEVEIKAAFKRLAKQYHPDKNNGNPAYEEKFKKINAAYQVLSDNTKRARYDYILSYQAQKRQPPYSPSGQATRPQPRTYTPPQRPKQQPPDLNAQKKKKYIIIILAVFIVFGIGVDFFYNFMNKVTAKDRLRDGKAYEADKKDMLALDQYSQAIGFDASLSEAFIRRAQLRYKVFGDINGALNDFTLAIKNSEKPDYNLYFQKAKFSARAKKYEESLKDLDLAIQLNPNYDSLYFYKAEINNYLLKNYATAILEYNNALKINPNFKDALFGKAISEQNSGDYIHSINNFNTLINKYPENGEYYYYRSWSKLNNKDLNGGCEDLSKAKELNFSGAEKAIQKYCIGADQNIGH